MKEWVNELLGTKTDDMDTVRNHVKIDGEYIVSDINGKRYKHGTLDVKSLRELKRVPENGTSDGTFTTVNGDVRDFINNVDNKDALFQVASQFNLLEMMSPEYTPEHGLNIYSDDHTQGPICAMACGAGTIYRNYFDSYDKQTNTLWLLEQNIEQMGLNRPWKMVNGYALFNKNMVQFDEMLNSKSDDFVTGLMGTINYGIHRDTEVTTSDTGHTVSQIYCSALPLSYQGNYFSGRSLKTFSRLILESLYEATICAGITNYERTGCNKVFLTYVGGGAFGNDMNMIKTAMERAVDKYKHHGLEVVVIKYKKKSYWE